MPFYFNTLHQVAPNQSSPKGDKRGACPSREGGEVLYVKAMLLGGKSIVIRR